MSRVDFVRFTPIPRTVSRGILSREDYVWGIVSGGRDFAKCNLP